MIGYVVGSLIVVPVSETLINGCRPMFVLLGPVEITLKSCNSVSMVIRKKVSKDKREL